MNNMFIHEKPVDRLTYRDSGDGPQPVVGPKCTRAMLTFVRTLYIKYMLRGSFESHFLF